MAAEAASAHAAQGPTAGEYIGHHLTHWRTHEQTGIVDFTVFNIDSIDWSVLMGLLGLWVLRGVARRVTSGVPGRMQAAVEIVLEMVDNQAKSIVHNAQSRKFVGPLALTVFIRTNVCASSSDRGVSGVISMTPFCRISPHGAGSGARLDWRVIYNPWGLTFSSVPN